MAQPDENLSLRKAIRVLQQFSVQRPELGVTEVTGLAGLPRSVVHRVLGTLASTGFLEQDPQTAKYRIGLLAYEVGNLYPLGAGWHQVVQEELRQLVQVCTHTCCFGVMRNRDVVLLAVCHGSSPIRIAGEPGDRIPAHATAMGKAVLSAISPADLDAYLAAPLLPFSPTTITNPDVLRAELDVTRRQTYSTSREETYLGMCAVGAVIRDLNGETVGGLSALVPSFAFTPERIAELTTLTKNYAARIGRRVPRWRLG